MSFNVHNNLMVGAILKPACFLLLLFIVIVMFSGCNSTKTSFCVPELAPESKFQLSEQEVLDTQDSYRITEESIQRAFKAVKEKNFDLGLGARIILVQSGKQVPDTAMQEAMLKYYRVSVYSGIAPDKSRLRSARKNDPEPLQVPGSGLDGMSDDIPPPSYMKRLRLIAAKAKQEKIIVYWSNLEQGYLDKGNKTIFWRGYTGGNIAPTTKYLRYLIRFALVDVNTGMWVMYSPTNQQNEFVKFSFNTQENDVMQISKVKEESYRLAAQSLFDQFERFNLQ